MACGVEEVQNGVLREDFSTKFEKVPEYEATLNFYVKESVDRETRKRMKEEKQKDKQRKKEEREIRIAKYAQGKSKKENK